MPCGDLLLPRVDCVVDDDILLAYTDLNGAVATSWEEALELEQETRGQAATRLWFDERRKRLTSSNFSKIVKRKKAVTPARIKNVFEPAAFESVFTTYGKNHEGPAKQQYLKQHPAHHIHDCGLVVNPQFSFLAASPDGKVCVDGETGVLEVKCPFTARDITIAEAVERLPKFCLEKSGDTYSLKKNHDYYSQVQGQIMVTGVRFCMFVVYTRKDMFCARIEPDGSFIKEMFGKLAAFCRESDKFSG